MSSPRSHESRDDLRRTNPIAPRGVLTYDAALRDAAVEAVDARYGYTIEFAAGPGGHLAAYDEEELRLHQRRAKGPPA